jgi:hypothetical protein
MAFTVPKPLKPVLDLVIQVAIGAIAFIALLLIAAIVAGIVKLLGALSFAPPWLAKSADGIERGIFWFDVGCLVLFLTAEAIKFVRGLWNEVIRLS